MQYQINGLPNALYAVILLKRLLFSSLALLWYPSLWLGGKGFVYRGERGGLVGGVWFVMKFQMKDAIECKFHFLRRKHETFWFSSKVVNVAQKFSMLCGK